ncbi:DUF418 domain-containing protein [Sphaerisporangium album]|uniref:DUF418 domain-containing protein n=1 Tax=Sphaerisporangium album TaxID=509200 RepID=A0A367FHA0_9ACTN|nr:DUF418 domain-containing protein [Sphaerisporangium album]RCG28990.1 DUF418 domain-containing protein [Sphaerisporangium album]
MSNEEPGAVSVEGPVRARGPGGGARGSSGRQRIGALDVVRGFALCGILVANVQPIANVGDAVQHSAVDSGNAWVGLLVEQRFFPIFSLLFGIGFSLLLESAGNRAARPRLILLRRLLVLLGFGLVHMLLWRGDVLTVYAIVGLLVLLPSTWLPRWAVAGLGVVLLGASFVVYGGGSTLVPGLFLLGSALTRYGVIDRIDRSTHVPTVVGLVLAAGAAPALWWQAQPHPGDLDTLGFALTLAVPGLLLAGVYVCALLVLLRTPLRPAMQVVFAPLGRMALTNYLTATVLVLVAARVLGLPLSSSWTAVFLLAAAILTVQWLFSTLWLRRYRQGPLEWLWRWATWARRPPLRHPSPLVITHLK